MARLHIVWDPEDRISPPNEDWKAMNGIKNAIMPVAGNLSDVDIYHVARKLAELLLEQLSRDQSQ